MNTLKYKDFIGSVAFSKADGVFFGKIEGIDVLVNFEGESVAELTDTFHEAVDDYPAYCAEEGIKAHKSYSGLLNVRLTPDIHTRVAYLESADFGFADLHVGGIIHIFAVNNTLSHGLL